MARNYKELQAKMDPASRADNERRVREELERMTLGELRSAKKLKPADLAGDDPLSGANIGALV
jgi:hypothetical protein